MGESYKNKVITISGEPASGKGTAVKGLQKHYEKQGYNVYVITVGSIFRRVAVEQYKKEHPEIPNPSIELVSDDPSFAEKRKEIDLNLDSYIAQKGKEINSASRPYDVYIIDSRLAFSNIPESFSIRLTVEDKAAGERVFGDATRGEEDQYETVEQAIEETRKRKEGEVERYKGIYDIDLTDESNYDLVINTSYTTPEKVLETIITSIQLDEHEKPYPHTWASPKWFLPMQGIMETAGPGGAGLDLKDFEKMLKEKGYNLDCPIQVIKVDGYYYIIEGHHRNFAAAGRGMTLIPYDLIATDDEAITYGGHCTARELVYANLQEPARSRFLTKLYDHEGIFDERDEDGNTIKPFYYTDIYGKYPEIPELNKDKEETRNDGDSR